MISLDLLVKSQVINVGPQRTSQVKEVHLQVFNPLSQRVTLMTLADVLLSLLVGVLEDIRLRFSTP
jgi:hypothetical protein